MNDIRSAQSAKSETVMAALDDRFEPMPDEMKEEILQGKYTLGAKEILEMQKARWDQERYRCYAGLLRNYAMENAGDSLVALLSAENTLDAHYNLASYHLTAGNYTQAESILTGIPSEFTLTGDQATLYQQYNDYFAIYSQLLQDTTGRQEPDSLQTLALLDLAAYDNEMPGTYARNLLVFFGKMQYQEPILLPDPNEKSSSAEMEQTTRKNTLTETPVLSIFPNPAMEYFIASYRLEENNGNVILEIRDGHGRTVQSNTLTGTINQQVIPLKGISNGLYHIVLKVNGKTIGKQKLVINN